MPDTEKNKNLLLAIIGVAIVITSAVIWLARRLDRPSIPQNVNVPATSPAADAGATPPLAASSPASSRAEPPRLPGEENLPPLTLVTYDGTAFSPATVTIKQGEVVSFKNEGPRLVWPASAVHPTHAAYPEKGGCLDSAFDACRGYGTGNIWSFKFDAKGVWQYHDHLNPSVRGTVVVE
ncbi:MAG: hypothetical protein HY536_00565 [Candidatus Colwellbacteria bacterium]|nr:hypothetical protein [Candidatus Colwellbacteria bacterium]